MILQFSNLLLGLRLQFVVYHFHKLLRDIVETNTFISPVGRVQTDIQTDRHTV